MHGTKGETQSRSQDLYQAHVYTGWKSMRISSLEEANSTLLFEVEIVRPGVYAVLQDDRQRRQEKMLFWDTASFNYDNCLGF